MKFECYLKQCAPKITAYHLLKPMINLYIYIKAYNIYIYCIYKYDVCMSGFLGLG